MRTLDRDEARHLLRRLSFSGTPAEMNDLSGLDRQQAFERLWSRSRVAPPTEGLRSVSEPWTNSALRYADLADAQLEARRAEQKQEHKRQIRSLREAWIRRMVSSPAGLRENLILFLHDLFGSSSATVEIPYALAARDRLYERMCMRSFPELLVELVLDPAMMIQIGMDGHGPFRVSDRPAVLILEHWTVGAGAYSQRDVGELSRALTGWTLRAPVGQPEAERQLDPAASLAERRTGLVPVFDASQFEAGPKTILGETADFDARAAITHLARQPATARRFAHRLLRFFGVADPSGRLAAALEHAYLATGGSMHALLGTLVAADEFWSSASRWSLIKSPVHLAVGACRQLALDAPPVTALDGWLAVCGQTLFETPNNGEGGWPVQEAWIEPPDRLAIRYQLPAVLAGETLELGLAPASVPPQRASPAWLPGLTRADEVLERLDPAPGLGADALRAEAGGAGVADVSKWVRTIMATPHYQLA